jgi:hypothetical protein
MKYDKMIHEAIQACKSAGEPASDININDKILEALVKEVEEMKGDQFIRSKPANNDSGHCSSCSSHKLVQINAKCSDMCWIQWYPSPKTGHVKEQTGYVPSVLGLGHDSDYIEMELCIACGQIQNFNPEG